MPPIRPALPEDDDLVQTNFELPRATKARLKEIAKTEERTLTAELRYLVRRRVQEFDDAGEESLAA